jgi:hypothetical protein
MLLALNTGDVARITSLMADIAHRVVPHLGD